MKKIPLLPLEPAGRCRGWSCDLRFSRRFRGADLHGIHSLFWVVPPLVNPSGIFCMKQRKACKLGTCFKPTLGGSFISEHHSSAGTVCESQRPLCNYSYITSRKSRRKFSQRHYLILSVSRKASAYQPARERELLLEEKQLQHLLWPEGRNRERKGSFALLCHDFC